MKDNFNYNTQNFFSKYLENVRNCSENTKKTYATSFLIFIQYLKEKDIDCDELNIQDIKPELVFEFIKWLKAKGNSASTINNRICALKSFFNYLSSFRVDLLETCSIISNIRLLRQEKYLPKYLTVEELEFMFNSINTKFSHGLKTYTIIVLLYESGMRVQELCDLKIQDIFFSSTENYVFVANGKGKKERNIPIDKAVANLLRRYIYSINEGQSYLFLNKYNEPYTRRGINYLLNKEYKIAKSKNKNNNLFKLDTISPHMLRHSKAIALLNSDVSLETIKVFLGHENVETTEIYARILPEKVYEVIEENAKTKQTIINYPKRKKESLENWLRNI